MIPLEDFSVRTTHSWNYIDFSWMKKKYPEIEELFQKQDDFDAEEILLLSGKCGYQPNPYFDESYYVNRYSDVRNAISRGEFVSGFDHYRRFGYKDRNPHWLFCEEYYITKYVDVARQIINGEFFFNGYDHYLQVGDLQFRSGTWFFDPLKYLKCLFDGDVKRPFRHYMNNIDQNTNIPSVFFDENWYINSYPNTIAELNSGLYVSALHKYLSSCFESKFDPSCFFSEEFYLESNPDVFEAVQSGRFSKGYEHFLLYGIQELRSPHPNIDLKKFYHNSYVQDLLLNGRISDVFVAWCVLNGKITKVEKILYESEESTKFSFQKKSSSLAINVARTKLDFSFKNPLISVIVVIHNNFNMTINSLTALRSSYPNEIQLIIVDSASSDENRCIENYVINAKILRFEGNIGFIRSCNEAVKFICSPYILFLNNDTEIKWGSIQSAIKRFDNEIKIGVIGGKIIRTNGLLQEAGAIIYRDGSVEGYLRDCSPDAPEANFVRRVDFCSGAALFTRTELFRKIGGFDENYIPAYYEETDYCVKIWKSNYEVIYDPSINVIHYEYASSSIKEGTDYINRNRYIFNSKHRDFLLNKKIKSKLNSHLSRSIEKYGSKRILFIEDKIPLKSYGSGFSRSYDIINTLSTMQHEITLFPVFKSSSSAVHLYEKFPDSVEIMWDRDINDLEYFITMRSGMYDAIWICRTQNVGRIVPIIEKISHLIPLIEIIADTEAVSTVREEQHNRLKGLPQKDYIPFEIRLRSEFECLSIATKIVAVNDYDASLLKKNGFNNVYILGHVQTPNPTPNIWSERSDLLFVGAIHDYNSPNYDSIIWMTTVLWPKLEKFLPIDVNLIIVGHLGSGISFSSFPKSDRIKYIGKVDDIYYFYNRCRLFLAPTRFAAGIPYKIYEAASHGLPIVASNILCDQVKWNNDKEIISAENGNFQDFIEKIIDLYSNKTKWSEIRSGSFNKILIENCNSFYVDSIKKIIS